MNCMKCKTEMFSAKLCADTFGMGAYLTNKKKGLLESEKQCAIKCFVCPNCGYVELQADEPKKIRIDK